MMNKWLKSILITILFVGILLYGIYFYDSTSITTHSSLDDQYKDTTLSNDTIDLQPMSYISIDINPSIEFILNKDQRIISYQSNNIEGKMLLNKIDLFHKTFADALQVIVEQLQTFNLINRSTDVYFTICFDEMSTNHLIEKEEMELKKNVLENIKSIIYNSLHDQIASKQIYIWEIDKAMLNAAQSQKISPGKLVLQIKTIDNINAMEESLKETYQSIIESDSNKNTILGNPNNSTKQNKQPLEVIRPSIPMTPNIPSIQEIPKVDEIPSIEQK